jgi:hypothetical protein
MATMTVFATTYVGEPDIPAGLTISEFRRSRPRRTTWWRGILPRQAIRQHAGI